MDLYLASGNLHKVGEFRKLLEAEGPELGRRLRLYSARDAGGMPEVEEDTGTFEGNAGKKAKALLARLPQGAWALADDSGICVEALGGSPGVESAYYAGPQADSRANMDKLLREMAGVPEGQRQAYFYCLLCLAGPDGTLRYFEGRCCGVIALREGGLGGFGYDPIFIAEGGRRTYSELGDAEKNRISHRGRAWRAFADWVAAQPEGGR